ncbi:MAG TPA: hypothetical protein VEK34_17080 [Methylocella sp.]|nr:hypothetical protein [Methylocella sp.]
MRVFFLMRGAAAKHLLTLPLLALAPGMPHAAPLAYVGNKLLAL